MLWFGFYILHDKTRAAPAAVARLSELEKKSIDPTRWFLCFLIPLPNYEPRKSFQVHNDSSPFLHH